MNYTDGRDVRLGDVVRLFDDGAGTVVALPGDGAWGIGYPEPDWGHLEGGVLVESVQYGIVHLPDDPDDPDGLVLVRRADGSSAG